jgi:hypothetical protein
LIIALQILDQVKLGKQVDHEEIRLAQASEEVEKNSMPPPIFPDAVIHCDENCCVSSIGSAGHDDSFGQVQHHVAVHPKTGKLLRKAQGGVVPSRRFRVVAKYMEEARGCYGVYCPVIDGKKWLVN